MRRLQDLALAEKRVLIREDFNVPLRDGQIVDDRRIQAALPTLRLALAAGARVMVMSHLGRPKGVDAAYSLQPVADYLAQALGQPVPLVAGPTAAQAVPEAPGALVLWENVRFLPGEAKNEAKLAAAMAACCDIFVMDAFATAHRTQASTVGVAQAAPLACAGLLLQQELAVLDQYLTAPAHPCLAIVGGAKVSTKLALLSSLLDKVDVLLLGGGIANTFLVAQGHAVGQSLYEDSQVDAARALLAQAEARGVALPLPLDVVVAPKLAEAVSTRCVAVDALAPEDAIFDVGPQTQRLWADYIAKAGTVIWNGPVGVFEYSPFAPGTQALADAVARTKAHSIAGGGDTLAAIAQFGIAEQVTYCCTGGGAFLSYLQDPQLPGLQALQNAPDLIQSAD